MVALMAGLATVIAFTALGGKFFSARQAQGSARLTDADYLHRGTSAFAARQLPDAIAALTRALEKNPNNDTARLLLARAYLGIRDGAAAENTIAQLRAQGAAKTHVVYLAQALSQQGKYRQLLEQLSPDPNLPATQQAELLALRGQAYLYQGDLDNARQEIAAAREISADETVVQLALARLYAVQGQPSAATELLQQALDATPEEAEAWSLKAELALAQGNPQAAEEAYSKAITYGYSRADDLLNRALLRIQRGDYAAATEDLEQARTHSQEHDGILFAEGLMRLYRGDYSGAWDRLGQAVQANPAYLPGYFFLGLADFALGQWQQGEQHLARYLQALPHDSTAAMALASSQLLQGNPAIAVSTLRNLLVQNPRAAAALELLGYLYLAEDAGLPAGIETLQRAVALQPDAPLLRARLGFALWLDGRNEQAAQEFQRSAALRPGDDQLAVVRLLQQLRTGRFGAAQQQVETWRAQQPDKPLPEVLQGVIHLKTGQSAAAQAAFERALRLQPGHFAATLGAVGLALTQQQPDRAHDLLQQALQAQPANPVYLLQMAALEYRLGQVPEAGRHLAAVLQLKPEALAIRLTLARLWLQMGQAREAVKVLQQAPDAAPGDQATLQELLGQAQLAAGDWFDATETLRALSWSQASATIHYLLAAAYNGQGEQDAAQRELDKALASDPNYAPAQLVKARRLLAAKQWLEAQVLLAKLRNDRPGDRNVISLEGDLALAGNDTRRAVEAFQRLRRLDPDSNHWVAQLAQAQFAAGQTEVALNTCRDWLTGHPDDRQVYGQLAKFYLLAGRTDEAAAAYARLLQWQPDQPVLLINLAWLLRQRDPAKARQYAEQALQLQPNSAVFKGTLALLLLQQGKTERAIGLLKESLANLAQSLDTQFQLAQALAQTGDKAGARRYLRRIVEDPRLFSERPRAEALLKELAVSP